MNFKMIGRIISRILLVEAAFMLPALIFTIFDGDRRASYSFVASIGIIITVSLALMLLSKGAQRGFYAREGLVCVGLSWIVMSLLGCLPFWLSGEIPRFIDALFEIVSGFTTTGASILNDIEILPRGILYWRSFSHWLGGMGVLVFVMAIMPTEGRGSGYSMHLLRAESPGPSVGKLVPRMKQTAGILYIIYIALTAANFLFLLFGGMPWFDSLCTTFGCAGTGGFGTKNDSLASYSPYIQNVCAVFMLLFGINFNCYYLLLCRRFKSALFDKELRFYLGVAIGAAAFITLNIRGLYDTLGEAIRHSAFQVSSIMTTTGYATTDFDLWPSFSKSILLTLMIIGACAGSTGGGIKCGRVLILLKTLRRNVRQAINPQRVQSVRINNQVVDEKVLESANSYLAVYMIIVLFSFIIISLDQFSIMTNFSAVLACFNNIGPGLEAVGPTANYAGFSDLSKTVLIVDMLAGRLEIFPILVLFTRSIWRNS